LSKKDKKNKAAYKPGQGGKHIVSKIKGGHCSILEFKEEKQTSTKVNTSTTRRH